MRTLLLFAYLEIIPYYYIKYLRDNLYEFRVNYGSNEFRIFLRMMVPLCLFYLMRLKRNKAMQQVWEEYNTNILLDARNTAG